jgi:hypothetical protein
MNMIMKWMDAACWCEKFYGSGRAHEREDFGKLTVTGVTLQSRAPHVLDSRFSSVLLLPQSLTRVCRGVEGTQSALGIAR